MIKYASNSLLADADLVQQRDRTTVRRGRRRGRGGRDARRARVDLPHRRGAGGAPPVTAGIASFLEAGCGFGGSCLPKDVTALAAQGERSRARRCRCSARVLAINAAQPERAGAPRRESTSRSSRGVRVTVLGLAFKPDTDDLRESPAFPMLRLLREAGAALTAYDPVARPARPPGPARRRGSPAALEDAVADADVVVLVTRWAEFDDARRSCCKPLGRSPLVVDGRRVLRPAAFARLRRHRSRGECAA